MEQKSLNKIARYIAGNTYNLPRRPEDKMSLINLCKKFLENISTEDLLKIIDSSDFYDSYFSFVKRHGSEYHLELIIQELEIPMEVLT